MTQYKYYYIKFHTKLTICVC